MALGETRYLDVAGWNLSPVTEINSKWIQSLPIELKLKILWKKMEGGDLQTLDWAGLFMDKILKPWETKEKYGSRIILKSSFQ